MRLQFRETLRLVMKSVLWGALVGHSYDGRQYERLTRNKDGRYNRGALFKLELQVRLVKSPPGTAIVTRWEQPPTV